MQHQAIRVEVHRGSAVESSHVVHAVVSSTSDVIESWGDADRLTMPRSAIKSIQLLPMLTTGAAEAFDVSDDEVALAASSHGAESIHTTAVEAWLDRLELGVDSLECGPAAPITSSAAKALQARGESPTRLHNCCSGKHTGFLTLATHQAHDQAFALPGYLHQDHGVQQLVRGAQEQFTGVDLGDQMPVIDGCGIPVYRFPLTSLAHAMARLVTPESIADDGLRMAAARVVDVLPTRALLVSGTGRAEQVLTDAATEPVILKGGAEGVFMAAVVDRGVGLAMKCEDGSNRGVEAALAAVLHRLGVTPDLVPVNSPVRNAAGDAVGKITAALH